MTSDIQLDLPPFVSPGPYTFSPGSTAADYGEDYAADEVDLLDLHSGSPGSEVYVARIRYWETTPESIAQSETDARFLRAAPETFASLSQMVRLVTAIPCRMLSIEVLIAEQAARASMALAEHGPELSEFDRRHLPELVPTRATPGPYAIGKDHEGVDDKLVIYSAANGEDVAEIIYWATADEWSARSHANAKLLAATPYLYSALHGMLTALGTLDRKVRTTELDAAMHSATAILAKGEGRA